MGQEMPVNEPSGSHQIPQQQQQQQQPHASYSPSTSIDIRTIGLIAAAILGIGGGATGIGSSLGGSGVAEKVEVLTNEVRDLRITVERKTETEKIYRDLVTDLDKRVRSLEKRVPD